MMERRLTNKRVQRLSHDVWFRDDAAALAELTALYRMNKRELDALGHRDAILRKVLARVTLDELASRRSATRGAGTDVALSRNLKTPKQGDDDDRKQISNNGA